MDNDSLVDEDEFDHHHAASRNRMDEDDDGVFGTMEE
jgi:hypothetical protein